jgi:hypothetical protein
VPNHNGEVVPIRDATAIADAIVKFAEITMKRTGPAAPMVDPGIFSFATFEREFLQQLAALGLAPALANPPDSATV